MNSKYLQIKEAAANASEALNFWRQKFLNSVRTDYDKMRLADADKIINSSELIISAGECKSQNGFKKFIFVDF